MLILKKFEPVYSTASFYDKLSYSYFEKLKTFSPGGWILIGSLSIYLNKTFVYVFPIYFEIFFSILPLGVGSVDLQIFRIQVAKI